VVAWGGYDGCWVYSRWDAGGKHLIVYMLRDGVHLVMAHTYMQFNTNQSLCGFESAMISI
jgi:hypothetical protein